jgi:hypothetical protein
VGFDPEDMAGPALLRGTLVSGRFLKPGETDNTIADLTWAQTRGIEPDATGGPAAVMSWIYKGRKIENTGEMVVESHYAKFHNIRVDDPVVIDQHRFKVVGIAKIQKGISVAAANYYITLDDAEALAGMDMGSANMFFFKVETGDGT